MTMADAVPGTLVGLRPEPEERALSLTWLRFRRHRLAVAGLVLLAVLVVGAVGAPAIAQYDPSVTQVSAKYQPPSLDHPLGTDGLGRDLFLRSMYAGRISLLIGLLAMALSVTTGTLVGSVAGYLGGIVDTLLMRFADIMLTLPTLFVAILLTQLLRAGLVPGLDAGIAPIVLVVALTSWMGIARLVRASFLSLKERDYVEAARSSGAPDGRIMVRHILPNAMSPIIVAATLRVGAAILIESGLSYLGFGVQPPLPTWGNMLQNAQSEMGFAPWTAIFPGLFILATVLAVNYVGDGLRDALDPQYP